jgi:hypothetical protein
VVTLVNERHALNFTVGEVTACIDSLLRPPTSKSVARMSIKDATAGCLAMIKNQ